MRRYLRAALIGAALLPSAGLGSDTAVRSAEPSLIDEAARLSGLSDAESQLRLAEILSKGLPVSAHNSLRRPDLAAARAAYGRVFDMGGATRVLAGTRLAKMLLFGEGGPRDLTGAERLLKQAVEAGNAEAAHLLARHYETGTFGERRPVDSIAFYRTAFRLGDATAGRALAKSLGLSTDSGRETADATVKRLERGVIEGKADAALVLGDLFRRGELVAEDPGEALKLYESAARLGSTEAYLRLARLHLSFGKGADGPEKAREWLLKGAEAGQLDAALTIAIDGLFHGRFSFNSATALQWLRHAEQAGSAQARVLGFLNAYRSRPAEEAAGKHGTADLTAQLEGLTISPAEIVTIGRLILLGSTSRSTMEAAHVLLRHAAAAGNIDGDYWIGRSILKKPAMFGAEGWAEAIKSLDRAVRAGHGPAAAALAEAYRYGIGLEPSLRTAAELYEKAIDHGGSESITAMFDYASMLRKEGDAADAARAVEVYKSAADQGSVEASVVLGRLFLEGREVSQDVTAATRLLRRAIEQGSTDAMVTLGDHLAASQRQQALKEAEKLFADAWAHQDYRGLSRLASMHHARGEAARSRDLLETAAQEGSLDAALRLVTSEARAGRIEEARRWKTVAHAAAGPSAPKKVKVAAALLKTGRDDLKADAMTLLTSLADEGNLDATVLLGRTLLASPRGDADPKDALQLLNWAADQNSNEGRLALAEALRRGQGAGVQDHVRAVAMSAAVLEADPANAAAALALARAHERGEGVPRDAGKAMTFYQRAAKLGSTTSDGSGGHRLCGGDRRRARSNPRRAVAQARDGRGRRCCCRSARPFLRLRWRREVGGGTCLQRVSAGSSAWVIEGNARHRAHAARRIRCRAGHIGGSRMDAARLGGQHGCSHRVGTLVQHGRGYSKEHGSGARSFAQRRPKRSCCGHAPAWFHVVATGQWRVRSQRCRALAGEGWRRGKTQSLA